MSAVESRVDRPRNNVVDTMTKFVEWRRRVGRDEEGFVKLQMSADDG